ncbi:MAG: hypothetical protein PGN13_15715 [Patulibacter minatonensis]
MHPCTTSCHGAAACRLHVEALLRLHGTPDDAEWVRDSLDTLLPLARAGTPHAELDRVAELLRRRIAIDADGSLDPSAFLRSPELPAHPVLAGALAVTAARAEGVALGVLTHHSGRLALAHASLPDPVVIELTTGYPQIDVTGSEAGWRWACAHELAALTGLGLPVASG